MEYLFGCSNKVLVGDTYDEFGNQMKTGEEDFLNEATYTGAVYDSETNLHYMNARYYSSETGQFISKDTYLGEANSPWTQNLYSYTGGNPVNFIDPTGHSFLIIGGILVVGGLINVGATYISNKIAGTEGTFGDYAAAFVGGVAGTGVLMFTKSTVGAGAVNGFVSSTLSHAFNGDFKDGIDLKEGLDIGANTLIGGVSGAISAKIPGLNSGRNSFQAITRSIVTKSLRKSITRISVKTLLKITTYLASENVLSTVGNSAYKNLNSRRAAGKSVQNVVRTVKSIIGTAIGLAGAARGAAY